MDLDLGDVVFRLKKRVDVKVTKSRAWLVEWVL